MYIKIVIDDLQPGSKSVLEQYNNDSMKIWIKAQQKLSERIPRDKTVWEKFWNQKRDVKLAKVQYKMRMNAQYPGWTNKSAFYTQKALIWS